MTDKSQSHVFSGIIKNPMAEMSNKFVNVMTLLFLMVV
jgi:hypothetical protein